MNNISGQFIINPQPECFGHFGDRIPLLFTTFWGNSQPAEIGRYKLPRYICEFSMGGKVHINFLTQTSHCSHCSDDLIITFFARDGHSFFPTPRAY